MGVQYDGIRNEIIESNMNKLSIRFFKDQEVRAVWDEDYSKWWFSVVDIVGAINIEPDYNKSRNYWKYLKTKLKKENDELVSATHQLKMTAPDGKKRLTIPNRFNTRLSAGC